MFNRNNKLLLILIAGGLIIVGAIVYSQNNKPQSNGAISIEENIKGNPTSPVTITVFSDFQCPFCANYHKTLQQISGNYPDKVYLVFKHFPLPGHPQSRSAANAAECAAEQGKFWEFADKLFENQARLGENDFYQKIAADLNLNVSQFTDCISSKKYNGKVEKNYQEGLSKKIKGTPASFINGETLSGAASYEKLKGIIDNL